MASPKKSPAVAARGIGDMFRKLADSMLEHHGAAVTPDNDGAVHRLDHPDGHRGNKRLWYVLHHDFGVHGDWSTGKRHLMFADGSPDPAMAQKARERAEQAKREREAERARQHALVADMCRQEWPSLAKADPLHPYLVHKCIGPAYLRQQGNRLVVPLSDGERLMNFQFIGPQGTKRFRPGGRVTGCYHSFGEFSLDRPLLIAEGWATAMTLHEATGLPVAAAMNAGNLRSVAESLRARYPSIAIIVCADNDHSTTGNPGVTKGKDAASAVGGICIWPEFAAGDPGSDFNDAVLSGAKVVL